MKNMTIIFAEYKSKLKRYQNQVNRFWCPVCNTHTLTFAPTGAWNCWNDPERIHRLEILAVVVPDFGKTYHRNPVQSPPPDIILPPIPLIPFTQLHLPITTSLQLSEVIGNQTIYHYSDCQQVIRWDYRTHKVIRPRHFNGKDWIHKAGNRPWVPFGLVRLASYPGLLNIVLIIEGQKCVEIASSRCLPAVCLEAGDYSTQTIAAKLEAIRARLERVFLVVLPDYNLAGLYRARNILEVAYKSGIPAIALDPLKIKPDLKVGDDIEQIPELDIEYFMKIIREKERYGLIRIERRPVAATHPIGNGRNQAAR
jgi:hypothetical protein